MAAPTRGGSGWTLSRRLGAALVGFSLLLLVAGLGLIVVLRRADRALTRQTQRTFPARVAASQLLTSVVDQETGLRGFALTQDQDFLDPYRKGLVDEQEARAQLERFIQPGDPARLALANVDAAITAWRDQYASLRTSGASGTGADSTTRFGRELFVRVRQTNAALDVQLTRQVNAARANADRDRNLVLAVLGLMAVAVAAAVVGLRRALQTTVLRPMSELAKQVAIVSRGEHTTAIRPEGPPDIQAMGAGVESMRLELLSASAEVEKQRRGLELRAIELARSNADLEQFAYVASHDLQEPLRKVASFCQLLEQRYAGQLDERADQYIAFAVDGATRMQRLINDLLAFSRVGRTSEGRVSVELAATVAKAWSELDARVQQAEARLEVDLAPGSECVIADPSLLHLLFTNLLGNAVKYRQPDVAPVVRVTTVAEEPNVRVQVADNGIGIPDEYAEKVFVIFQRLHGREEYEGTGIGLALAKKIVEFHGGAIAIDASPLGGTCISFTLPRQESPND